MHSSPDILVCGAGATGLTLALEFARRGIPFRLIEKSATPFPGSRGKGIQPRTQEIFEDLGILDALFAAGGIYPPVRTYRDDGSWFDADIAERVEPTAAEPHPSALMVPQFLTERVMRDRLAELGHQVEWGTELTGFDQDANGVTARVHSAGGDTTIRVRYLIGADGGHSYVRGALGVPFAGRSLGARAIVADVILSGLGRDAWHQFNMGDRHRMMAICPLAGTGLFQVQAAVASDAPVDLTGHGLAALVAERSGRDDIKVQSVSWASDYQMSARLAGQYRAGRVFLAGDAAHVHPPTGGQGLNTSVQDAYNLGWKLAAVLKGADQALLDTYEAERRPVAESMLGLSTRLLQAQQHGDMRRGREVRQLDIGYRDSALALELPARIHGLRAGDRAPDAPVRGASGQPTRLFQLFQGTHWTLLAYQARLGAFATRAGLRVRHVGPDGDTVDAWGHVQDAYGLAPGDCVLVRPDGYVAAIAHAGRLAELDAYLRRMAMPASAARAD